VLVHLLNEYFTEMNEVIFKNLGIIDKFIGDAIMAVFGAPVEYEDHAYKGCLTAIGMLEGLEKINEKWKKEGKPKIDIGVGLNTGSMTVGNMGSNQRFDYTVMGDAVNLASRLEGTNKEYKTNIIISEFTYAAVKDKLVCRELDAVKVKGKKEPVRIYECVSRPEMPRIPKEVLDLFTKGLAAYRAQQWDVATKAFEGALMLRPEDGPSKIYIERCKTLKLEPPPKDWDGVFVMTKK
jgi:adenylate cyclase